MTDPITDPQGQGREGSRAGHQGGHGRQACEDQGCEGEETGARTAEAHCSAGRGRGVSDGCHDNYLAWVILRLKEGVISFLSGHHMRSRFMYVRVILQTTLLTHACPLERRLTLHVMMHLNVHKIGIMSIETEATSGPLALVWHSVVFVLNHLVTAATLLLCHDDQCRLNMYMHLHRHCEVVATGQVKRSFNLTITVRQYERQ